ncbi:MAG: UxaA family hydrolase [Deltaproteobacteria bacterium]|nr:UxaA family hydrolase [Deltaproteobacteria bacterium]
MMKPNVIIINPLDNVAIALEDISEGGDVRLPDGAPIRALAAIPYSHKVALTDIPEGENIVKYGEIIGKATETIHKGQWVHTHNLNIDNKR